MSKYLKIGEFAKLRNVNINSLLYYEKIGVLCPAYIDPDTKYRYYSPEQLAVLDTILLAIKLGIPLKNLKNYVQDDTFLVQKLLEDGKRLAESKIADIQANLNQIEHHLQYQAENRRYQNMKGHYHRDIRERFFITAPVSAAPNLSDTPETFQKLFHYAQEQNLFPVAPAGLLFRYQNGVVSSYIFLGILSVPDTASDQILHIPAASFECVRKSMQDGSDIFTFIDKEFGPLQNHTVIVTNAASDKFRFDNMQSEIQVLETPGA